MQQPRLLRKEFGTGSAVLLLQLIEDGLLLSHLGLEGIQLSV